MRIAQRTDAARGIALLTGQEPAQQAELLLQQERQQQNWHNNALNV
ncbi:MAG: hypothetical protein KME49_22200 [Brasilonema octagenarum HA4186-MV1]|nr:MULTISPECIES: hypothetical protein [Brasilonema]MBW4628146.1 hypothetical protein [Brasilonema octagenarum HA4186-MV1]